MRRNAAMWTCKLLLKSEVCGSLLGVRKLLSSPGRCVSQMGNATDCQDSRANVCDSHLGNGTDCQHRVCDSQVDYLGCVTVKPEITTVSNLTPWN